jgi:hypothetical protein
MDYIIGGLGGALLVAAFLFLFSKFGGNLNGSIEFNRTLMEYWQVATQEHREENRHLARIADAVTAWEQRYTRRKGKREEAQCPER